MSSPELMPLEIPKQLSRPVIEHRLRKFGKPSIAEISDAIAGYHSGDEPVILGGSLGLGLGNEKSDIDVLLLNLGSARRPAGPFQVFVGGERIEVVRVDVAALESLTGQIAQAMAGNRPVCVSHADLRVLSRVAYGYPIGGPPAPAAFAAMLARTCHQATIQRSTESARQHALVAVLAAEQDDGLIACWNARGAIEAIAQRDVLRSGAPYAGSKWLTEQLAESGCGLAVGPLLRLPAAGNQQGYLSRCLAVIMDSLGITATVRSLGEHARWDTSGLRHHHLGACDVLVHERHNALVELTADEVPGWSELRAKPDQPIGLQTRVARDAGWTLYLRGLAGIRWTRGGGP